jgi:uncharacterized membrane protein
VDWKPAFTDYLYLSFTNAISFSAGDVAPLTRWAKLMMMLQSAVSVAAIALVIARAVNILDCPSDTQTLRRLTCHR